MNETTMVSAGWNAPALSVIMAIVWAVAAACATGQTAVPVSALTEITMERRCQGCDREMKVTLRRDGTASKTTFGNRRAGTADRESSAALTGSAFDQLAQLAVAEGYFQLNDEYLDPELADGERVVTTILAGNRRKIVIAAHGKAPASLIRLQARIDDLAKALPWKAAGGEQ